MQPIWYFWAYSWIVLMNNERSLGSREHRLNLFYKWHNCSPIPSCMKRMKQNLTLCDGFKYMSPRKLVVLSAIRRPPYKTTVAPNIYITTCYAANRIMSLFCNLTFLFSHIESIYGLTTQKVSICKSLQSTMQQLLQKHGRQCAKKGNV